MLTRSATRVTCVTCARIKAVLPSTTSESRALKQLTDEYTAAFAAESELRAGAGKAVLEAQHAAELRQDAVAHGQTLSSRGQVSACTLVSHTS